MVVAVVANSFGAAFGFVSAQQILHATGPPKTGF
jgi:hypothetical protein